MRKFSTHPSSSPARGLTALLAVGSMTLAACIGKIGDGPDAHGVGAPGTDPTAFTCDPATAALTPSPIKRLAKVYFENAVRELLSPLDDAAREELMASIQTRLDLIPTDGSDHYSPNDDRVTQDHVDAIFGVALSLSSKIAEDTSGSAGQLLAVCGEGADKSALAEDGCLSAFLDYYGRKAFRRPLTPAEIDDFKAFYQLAVAEGVDGLGALIGRLIGHPNFYYRFDSEGDAAEGTEGQDAVYVLTRWELLSKITFLFWAAPPTDALYDHVESTDITEDDALRALLADVLADPRAEQGTLGFYREWLELDKTKAPATEGNVVAGLELVSAAGIDALPPSHRENMIQEVLDLARHYTLSTDGTLGDMFTSPYSFARTPELATIYGVEPWDGTASHQVSLPDGQRSGLLTRAAMVASNTEYTRPIIKGKLIRTRILCTDVPPPPPGLQIKPLVHPADQTTREAVEEATADATCQACHQHLNSLGFLSENYDPLGRFRDKELRFAEGTGEVVSQLDLDLTGVAGLFEGDTRELADAVELGEHLAESGQADACFVENYFEFVTGRSADAKTDGCDLVHMRDKLTAPGGSIKAMLMESVLQESFRRRKVN
jgi:Protein of unknown function (DUF1588)/Protein of unknown function (DUF1592)/Protein of unknown function (DUF1585)